MNESDLKRHIALPLKKEFATALDALRKTIAAVPADEWCAGEEKHQQPVRQAAHLLFAIENYLGGHKARLGGRFGQPIESFSSVIDPKQCPKPKDMDRWIDEVEAIAMKHIDAAVGKSISGSAKQHPPLNRPTYVLRHTVVHLTKR